MGISVTDVLGLFHVTGEAMEFGIAGRNALVTGGSLGIGRAAAAALAAEGVNVVIAARDEARLREVAEELTSNSEGRVVPIRADMSKADDIAHLVSKARATLGAVDILVNNAGSSPAGRLEDLSDEEFLHHFELKVMGYIRTTRALLPDMRAQNWGRIVNVAGLGGRQTMAGYILGAYVAALLHFTKALAEDCGPDGVTVNAVNPAATDTPRWRYMLQQRMKLIGISEEEAISRSIGVIPMGRPGTAEEVAESIAFLCSERASFVNGALLDVDGGANRGL